MAVEALASKPSSSFPGLKELQDAMEKQVAQAQDGMKSSPMQDIFKRISDSILAGLNKEPGENSVVSSDANASPKSGG